MVQVQPSVWFFFFPPLSVFVNGGLLEPSHAHLFTYQYYQRLLLHYNSSPEELQQGYVACNTIWRFTEVC